MGYGWLPDGWHGGWYGEWMGSGTEYDGWYDGPVLNSVRAYLPTSLLPPHTQTHWTADLALLYTVPSIRVTLQGVRVRPAHPFRMLQRPRRYRVQANGLYGNG